MPEWRTDCPDWAQRLRDGRSIIPPPIFVEPAQEALAVFKSLRIVDVAGSPTFGECCAPWVFDLVASIFGAYDPDTGRRLITEWFICLPKKNMKSTLAAGVMMTALVLNWRQSAEFAILAPTKEIALNSFTPAADMCGERVDEEMSALMHVSRHTKTVTNRTSGAALKVVAADTDAVGGKKSVGTLVDELWIFGKRPEAENMLREAIGGLASRPEGFVIYLTTQSDDPPAGVFLQKLQYARQVRDGENVDRQFVPIIYEFPDDMIRAEEHLNPANFGMVNPNLGFSVDEAFLQREFRKAKDNGEGSLRGFLAKHANVQIGLALRSDRWAGADFWQRAARRLTLDEIIERSDVLMAGIDGGGLDDLLGLCILGRDGETGEWMAWLKAWAHPVVLERRKSEAARFKDFKKSGDLELSETIGADFAGVAEVIKLVDKTGRLDKIGVDPSGIAGIVKMLREDCHIEGDDAGEDRIVGISQGWKLTSIIKTSERMLAGGTLVHCGQDIGAWCVGNARVEPRGNAVIITKQASGTAKIDPILAMFNACTLMSLAKPLDVCDDAEVLAV